VKEKEKLLKFEFMKMYNVTNWIIHILYKIYI